MNALSFVATTLVAGAFLLPAQEVVKTTASSAEPTLRVSQSLRALVMQGDVGRPFAMFVGERLESTRLAPGVVLELEPIGVYHAGALDVFGHAFVPIDLQAQNLGVDRLYFQSVLWPGDIGDYMPDQMTEVCEVVFGPFQTTPPDDPPDKPLYVVCSSPGVQTDAVFVQIDGVPPQIGVAVFVTAPTSGYVLRSDAVLHAGQFTRVMMTLERPSDAELVEERLTQLSQQVPLGVWVGQVEVLIRDLRRPPPVVEPKTAVALEGKAP